MAAGADGAVDSEPPRYLVVGTVRKPHGIAGEISIALETDRPNAVFRPGRVLVVGDARGWPRDERLTIERVRPFKDGLLLKVAEHATRTEATDQLRGQSLMIRAEEAQRPADDEVFYHDLVGLRVIANREVIGTVREVLELPSGLLLAVRREDAGELLLPFVRELIRRVDPAAGELEIDPPPGLLEL